ncbi:GDSL-type esterase/lipase family protein [Armatimonas rosea]|uniref:Lysophospholipase L1-like esterase n=1 Tax=Armatimonas rosea TaxID=685828 RepID=A0A7W9W5R0_ARMRO|nr:GDSL-type esterase/lipase family protein [Armatimonas rosea]MBB6050704.1 lysophospholipase L1-like esterase [Armatimonas rosea]
MQANPKQWEKEIAAFEAADRKRFPRPGGIVFVGSSTIRIWKSLEKDFPGYNTLNRGFGGSQLPDSTHFAPRILLPYQPRQIVLFAGTNDINAKRTPRQVAQDFSDFVVTVRQLLPRTRLSFIELTSSPSRWAQRDAVVETNRIIQRLCQRNGVDFIPVREKLFGPTGEPRPELFITDKLHLNADGYKILAEAVRPFLSR